MRKGVSERAVQRDAALQKNLFADRALAFDFREIIRSDGIDQSGDDVLARVTLLLGDANVGVDEGRAGRFELHRRRRGQREVGDVGHLDAEIALGALFEKRTGAGGTGVVHRVVNRHAVAKIDVFGILTANLENRVHVGVKVIRAGGLR